MKASPAWIDALNYRRAPGLSFEDRQPTGTAMCRNIKTLFNFEPPATKAEIRDASLQFVRKLSGFTQPSKANEAAFQRAVEDIAASAEVLIGSLVTHAQSRTREVEAAKARERSAMRYRRVGTGT
jgi:hypothetical protein